MKWSTVYKSYLLLSLLINDIQSRVEEFHHSKRLHGWDAASDEHENLSRHFHAHQRVEKTQATRKPQQLHHRKSRVSNTFDFPRPILKNELRIPGLKGGYQPKFSEVLKNVTVPRGRDARFMCVVDHLGGYRVGWVKVATKAIQAIHDHVITHNPRVFVSHSDHSTWYLLIKKVQEGDRGMYMCQVNTDPMIYQMAFLEVLHPPDFNNKETSDSIEVAEGGPLKLQCKAYGRPKPGILWRREDGSGLSINNAEGFRIKVDNITGEVLKLPKVLRSDMGNYLCIAYNGVPPTISKTIRITVRFHPMVQVPNQLVGAPLGTDITIQCFAEAYPRSVSYWHKDGKGEIIVKDEKYEIEIRAISEFQLNMTLKIKNLTIHDMGSYNCVCKNPVGEVNGQVRVYQIPLNFNERKYITGPGPRGNSSSDLLGRKYSKQRIKILHRGGSRTEKPFAANGLSNYVPVEHISSFSIGLVSFLSFPFLMPALFLQLFI